MGVLRLQGMDASGSPSTEEASMDTSELASMETTSTERNVCFSLFRKFVREVCKIMNQHVYSVFILNYQPAKYD